MARVAYLVDTSVLARVAKPGVATVLAPRAAEGRIALCAPVAFELGVAARSRDDYVALTERLAAFPFLPVTDGDHRRALELQGALVATGRHRGVSLVDALVAAVAEARGVTVLHYDADFELLAAVTGQQHEWIVARGTID